MTIYRSCYIFNIHSLKKLLSAAGLFYYHIWPISARLRAVLIIYWANQVVCPLKTRIDRPVCVECPDATQCAPTCLLAARGPWPLQRPTPAAAIEHLPRPDVALSLLSSFFFSFLCFFSSICYHFLSFLFSFSFYNPLVLLHVKYIFHFILFSSFFFSLCFSFFLTPFSFLSFYFLTFLFSFQ